MLHTSFDTDSHTWKVIPDLLGILGADSQFIRTNPAWQTVLGISQRDIESRPFTDFLHPDDLGSSAERYAQIKKGQPIIRYENRFRHSDGSYRWISWNAVPDGNAFFCIGRDVTEEKQNAIQLEQQEKEARFRDRFIAVLGHDLRNPVAAVGSALRLLGREKQTAQSAQLIDLAQQSVDRMSALITDVMDFARAQLGGNIGVDLQAGVALRPVLEQITQEIRLAHPDASFVETYAFCDPVTCDPDRISQLVSNLLANAAFHGQKDQPIQITAHDDGGDLVYAVANAGAKIPESTQKMLFEPFTRADARDSQNGLGLGLYIAQQIARGHGGNLSVHSDDAQTIFTLRMPRTQSL
ncbi:PAS domain-containing sensor histidine kinase [Sulfitobacter sp. S190]|uniref:PAS domain-containing sensor histidine kinase n=1 Tax=Sulfitobacter sp. S190 TaxID=2867022 RepID=UPI0021A699E4|nr:PAS domain-containing sensor histidine kinase [Sulfitobacter sp. S190]UWR22738.1 PAS domain-containing sensor histidine kinase [Sulfitobacter sp. S190]